jgi:hypothetical protein
MISSLKNKGKLPNLKSNTVTTGRRLRNSGNILGSWKRKLGTSEGLSKYTKMQHRKTNSTKPSSKNSKKHCQTQKNSQMHRNSSMRK